MKKMFWTLFKMSLKPFFKTTVKLRTFPQEILIERNQHFHIENVFINQFFSGLFKSSFD